MVLGGLAVGVVGGDALTQGFEAPHLGFCPASGMLAGPPHPDAATLFATVAQNCVSRDGGRAVFPPEPPVPADGDDGLGVALKDGGVAPAGVMGPVGRDRTDLLVIGDLVQQVWQGRAIALLAGGELHGPDVGCGRVHGQINLAPLAPARPPMLASVPFAIAKELDPGAIHQQVEGAIHPAIRDLDCQALLAAAEGHVVRHGPVLTRKLQKRPHRADRLAKRQLEQDLDREAEQDGHIGENRGPAHPARRLRKPVFLRIDQDQHRPSALKRAVIGRPIGGTVARRLWLVPRSICPTEAPSQSSNQIRTCAAAPSRSICCLGE